MCELIYLTLKRLDEGERQGGQFKPPVSFLKMYFLEHIVNEIIFL